ncbi:PREDICTED: uncharacterized protein LOC109588911 isoform X1 [Amphimedon queenslandica]|nr:PREDICTED: uncharacterized protein LOC109588911 isoform X1 [Amphimedon queenslandica]|eukprot:XP_019860570.1 PREDICTED: uncharacterized protein LOC109588911 isoform X1 [Amphimedon queenslandica]
MEVIEDECSITNVALLETIVKKYSIQDAGDKILAYQTHLDEFCKKKLTMLCNCQLKRLSSSLLTCEMISIRALLWKMFKDLYSMESLLVTARDNVDMLKEMGSISLTIGYYTVYDEHGIDEEVKSLMKKLETDALLEENAKLKGTIDTLESEKEESKKKMAKAMQMEIDHLRSSLQSKTGIEETLIEVEKTLIEREKEIEQLQQLKETLRKDQPSKYIDRPKAVYVATKDWKQEENNQLSIKEGEKFEVKEERTNEWWLARSLDTDEERLVPSYLIEKDEESELSTSELLELFHYAMTENVDIPKIKEIKTSNNVKRASLFLSLIKKDSALLDQLRKKEHGTPKAIRWYDDGVQLTSPSLIQCQEVVSLLTSKHRSIRIIKSSPDVVFDLLPVLLQNENVRSLTIRDTQLTQDCISSLCNLLANNKSLEGLYLCNCSIDDKAVADITNVLLQNNTLKGLSFQRNILVTSAISQSLSDLIKNSILEVLDLAGTSISSDGIMLILQSLLVNTKIKLYLHDDDKDICTEYCDYNIIKDRVFFY